MIPRAALQPGSSEPSNRPEVDALLTAVPELAFLPDFDGCVPSFDDSITASHADADDRMADLRDVTAALHMLSSKATSEDNGGLSFLVRTLLHFIEVKAVPPSQHPLIVALYLRGSARMRGTPETPAAIAAEMDLWR